MSEPFIYPVENCKAMLPELGKMKAIRTEIGNLGYPETVKDFKKLVRVL